MGMSRKEFLKAIAWLPLAASGLSMRSWAETVKQFPATPPFPVLFLGHGSPMNAIEENAFVAGFRQIAKELPRPQAILCISAHWETSGIRLSASAKPETIHDFGGFPPELFAVQYPAPGSPALAQQIQKGLGLPPVSLDHERGLDHGAWSVLKVLYPKANIPVVQMSLDYRMNPAQHYQLGQQLKAWRERGILIVGSGNMVHNLGLVDWRRLNDRFGFEWAETARSKMNQWIKEGNHQALIQYNKQGQALQLAIPSAEHFLPLLYTLGMKRKEDGIRLFNDEPVGGALSMTSVMLG